MSRLRDQIARLSREIDLLAAAWRSPVPNPSRRERDFARRQVALPGLAETGFRLVAQEDALAVRREQARADRAAAKRAADLARRQGSLLDALDES